jgi:hypothetical protein
MTATLGQPSREWDCGSQLGDLAFWALVLVRKCAPRIDINHGFCLGAAKRRVYCVRCSDAMSIQLRR